MPTVEIRRNQTYQHGYLLRKGMSILEFPLPRSSRNSDSFQVTQQAMNYAIR